MAPHPLAVVALVALLVLAGCSGAADGGPASGGADGASAGAGAQDDATPTPSGPVYELPSSGDALAGAHDAALQSAGSFTAETNVTSRDDATGQVISIVATSAVDRDTGAVLMHADVGSGVEQTVYVAPSGEAYQRASASGSVAYQRLEAAPDVTSLYRLPVASLVDESTLAYVGRDEVDGVPVAVYEVTDLESLVSPAGVGSTGAAGAESIQSFDVRLAVSADGLVRLLDYHVVVDLDGETRSMAMRIEYRDVGSTTVERPDWVDEVP